VSVSRYIVFAVLLASAALVGAGVATAQSPVKEVSVKEIHQRGGGNEYTVVQTWEKRLNGSASPPLVIGNHLYVGSEQGVKKVERATGETEWTTQKGEREPRVTASGGTLFVADGNLHRVDPESGERLWSFNRSGIVTTPTADSDSVYVGSRSGNVYSVDRETGEMNWRNVGLVDGFVPPPVEGAVVSKVENGVEKVYAGGLDSVYSLDKDTGEVVWETTMGDEMRSAPEYSDGTVYINDGNRLQAVDAENGVPVWNTETDGGPNGAGHPTVANGTVYFADLGGKAYSVNKTTGVTNWQTNLGSTNSNPPPTVDGGTVYVDSGELNAVSQASGEFLWRHESGGATTAANGSLYVNTGNRLYSVSSAPKALKKDKVVDLSDSFASFPHINIGDEGLENSTGVIRLDGYSEGGITVKKVTLWVKETVVRDSVEISVDGPSGGNLTDFIRRTGVVPVGVVSFEQAERPEDWLDGMNVSLEVNTSDMRILGERGFDTVHVYRANGGFTELHRQPLGEGGTSVRFSSRRMSDLHIGVSSDDETGPILYLNDVVFGGPSGTRAGGLITTDTDRGIVGELGVTNIGTRTADRSLRIRIGDKDVRTADLNLRPGESRRVSFEGGTNESGSYGVSVDGHRIGTVSVRESNGRSSSLRELVGLRRGFLTGLILVVIASILGVIAVRRRYTGED
jgi:outer membrane protein assembly factor BamB